MSNLDDLATAIVNKFLPKPTAVTEGDQLVYTSGRWRGGKPSAESGKALGLAAPPSGGDDTATILEAAEQKYRLRPGTYYFNGSAIDMVNPYLVGCGLNATTVAIGNNGYVFDCNQLTGTLQIEGVHFVGGRGVYRNRYTGSNVIWNYRVKGCYFDGQTHDIISHNASDMPYWHIEENIFKPANEQTSVCIALSGLSDKTTIRKNMFLTFRVAVKLNQRFANTTISDNDFIHFSTSQGQDRTAIWLVPLEPTSGQTIWDANVDAGVGTVISNNKFGPEHLATTDYRILLAPEGVGATNGERLPSFTKTQGWVVGLTIENNEFGSGVAGGPAPVDTWTPNFASSVIGRSHFAGYHPDWFLHYSGDLPTTLRELTLGPATRTWAGDATSTLPATNADPTLFWIETRSSKPNELLPLSPA